MPVTVRAATLQTVPVLIEAVGAAEGSKEVEIRARVTGLLQKQHYSEGASVRAGAPLYTIERAPYEIALAQARAAMAQEEARGEQARREAARLKPLADAQAISRKEYDDATSTLQLSDASLAAARAKIREAELNLSYTAVTSPIAGIAGRAEKSEGSLVSPTDGLLTHVTQTNPVWVRFSLSEDEQRLLRSANTPGVKLLSNDGKTLAAGGRLNFAASTVDAKLGTVQLRAEFANPNLAVLPGQFVRTQVQAGTEQAFLVPQSAVFAGDQGKAVWVVREGKATPAPVTVGGWVGGDWVVRKGLAEGDQVIVDNLLKLRPGAAVSPHGPAPADGASGPGSGATSGPASGAAPGGAPASAVESPASRASN